MNGQNVIISMADRELLQQMSADGRSNIEAAFEALAAQGTRTPVHVTYKGNRPEALVALQYRIVSELNAFGKDHPAFNAARDRILGSMDTILKSWAAGTQHFPGEEGPLVHEHVIKVDEHADAVILRKQLEGTGFKVVVVGPHEIISKEELENEEFKRDLREAMELDNQFVGKEFPHQRELLTAEVKIAFDQFCTATNDYKWLRDKIIGTMNAEFSATAMAPEGTVIRFPVNDPAANMQLLEDLRAAVLRGDSKITIRDIGHMTELGRQRLISSIGPIQHFPHLYHSPGGDLTDLIRQMITTVSDKDTLVVHWNQGNMTSAEREKLATLFGRMIKQHDLFMGNSLETQKSLLMQNIKALFVDFAKANGNNENWIYLQERFLKVLAYDLAWNLGPVDQDGMAFHQGDSHSLVSGMPKLGYDALIKWLIRDLENRRAESFTWTGLTDLTDAQRASFVERFKRALSEDEENTLTDFKADLNPNSLVEHIIDALKAKTQSFTWKGMHLIDDKQRERFIEQFQHALHIDREAHVTVAGGSAQHLAIGLRNVLGMKPENAPKTATIIGLEHMSSADRYLLRDVLKFTAMGDEGSEELFDAGAFRQALESGFKDGVREAEGPQSIELRAHLGGTFLDDLMKLLAGHTNDAPVKDIRIVGLEKCPLPERDALLGLLKRIRPGDHDGDQRQETAEETARRVLAPQIQEWSKLLEDNFISVLMKNVQESDRQIIEKNAAVPTNKPVVELAHQSVVILSKILETLEKTASVELHPMQSITLGEAPNNIEPLLEEILAELKKDRKIEWGTIPDVPNVFPRQETLPGGDMQFSYKGNTVTFGPNGDLTINASGSIKGSEYLG